MDILIRSYDVCRSKNLGRVYERQAAVVREIEAKEACDWLRAAGFPQYAQLFEDSQFPIDISPVKRDHDFLEKDLVEPPLQEVPLWGCPLVYSSDATKTRGGLARVFCP
ncbi:unnamed protein product [Boreogadus saida]